MPTSYPTTRTHRRAARPAPVRLALGSLVAVACMATAPAGALQNALANGNFPSSAVTPWTSSYGSIAWNDADFQSQSGSGSLAVNDDNGDSFYATASRSECLPVTAGVEIEIGGNFRSASGSPSGSYGRVGRFYYSDANCSEGLSGANLGFAQFPSNSWTLKTQKHVSPAGARSMKMEIVASSGSTSDYTLCADGLYVHGASATQVPAVMSDGFESGTLGAWTTVATGQP